MWDALVRFKDAIVGIFKEINNYLFIRRTIKKHQNDDKWRLLNLRVDYINRIYTVINLKPEDYNDVPEIKMLRFIEQLEPISDYMMDLNLGEILRPIHTEIPDSLSILVKLVPRTEYITVQRVLSFIIKSAIIAGLGFLLYCVFEVTPLNNISSNKIN